MTTLIRDPVSTAVAIERWARRRTGSATLARALGLAAAAEAEGHACAQLDAALLDTTALRLHPWVGDGSRLTPAVLTDRDEFFLWRNWRHEERIAAAVHARVDAAAESDADPGPIAADLARLFVGIDPQRGQQQRAAVAAAVGQRLLILSGGPGTGKTTTVLRLLLLRQRIALRAGRASAVALAAPTGKAAQRLSQSLRDGAKALRGALGADLADWEPALASLPEGARTLHRLLEWRADDDRFERDVSHPLPYDLVVIDEASMVDLALMRALFDALPPAATLILVGDPDQLVSVSAGSVLADLVAAAADGALARRHVRLQHVWRTEGRLADVYEAVRGGNGGSLAALIAERAGAELHAVDSPVALGNRLRAWLARPHWAELSALCAAPAADAAAAFAALRRLQLLTALRGTRFGAEAINDWIDGELRRAHGEARWYPGRPLLVRHNDYSRRLYNGDVGLTLRQGDELRVCFESSDAEGQISYRYLSPRELPEHDLGYALTIHQSQGSEYEHVAVLLPPEADHRILSRQLLYTGVSRARRSVEIWADAGSLATALTRISVRRGGLRRRLQALC